MKMKAKHINWNHWLVIGLLPFYFFTVLPVTAQIGTWRNYLSYFNIQQIQAAGDDIFVMASNGLYQYNKNDQSIYTYDKTNGLNDTEVSNIKWCPQAKRLVVIYKSANIDLIETNGDVINISDIYTKPITGDKSINSITISNHYAYLACGFGIVKLDVKDVEISESYMLGFSVKAIAISNNAIYAQSQSSEVWTANLNDNLIDPNNWQKTNNYPSFSEDLTDYNTYYETISNLKPEGPKYNYFGFMKYENDRLYTCQGAVSGKACIQILNHGEWEIFPLDDLPYIKILNSPYMYCIDYDPNDITHIFGGGINGLYEFKDGNFINIYNSDNSPIEIFDGRNKNYQMVTGVKYDKNGTLWLLNSQAPTKSLIELKQNGEFVSHDIPELMKLNDGAYTNKSLGNLSNMYFDSKGYLWFVNNNWTLPSLYRYNTQDNSILSYINFVNQDGTTLENLYHVTSVAEDKQGNMWVGTDVGPILLEESQFTASTPIFTQIKVPRNDGTNYADYLLDKVNTTSIAIDEGGRKWFGTYGNGVYLISEDNMTQLQHFTAANSALLSDNILSIAINNSTGEVYFGTDKGLCSYMSDATATNEEMTKDNVYAYPNPVTPGYTGLITIVGLTYNADVKILSSNGALIAQGKSNGGTFTWNGCDQKGNRVASGVYMVATATKTGEKGTVCKIAVVN